MNKKEKKGPEVVGVLSACDLLLPNRKFKLAQCGLGA